MTILPIRPNPNPVTQPSAPLSSRVPPRGISEAPDRLQPRREAGPPPSLFKKFLFEPILQIIKIILRSIFNFFDFLRSSAFDNPKAVFLNQLQSSEEIIPQFERLYSLQKKNEIYSTIGRAHSKKISWKEFIWRRTPEQDTALGRYLAEKNPSLLKDHLIESYTDRSK